LPCLGRARKKKGKAISEAVWTGGGKTYANLWGRSRNGAGKDGAHSEMDTLAWKINPEVQANPHPKKKLETL